jgi:tetratricopeptide (TPR) repeat protein
MKLSKIATFVAWLSIACNSWAREDLFTQADAAAQAGDFSRMQQTYEQILRNEPRNVRAFNGKATAQAWRGNYYAAQETFQKALAIEPDNLDSLVGIGYAFAWAGDNDDAQAAFQRALAISPTHVDALKGEAYLQLWSGNYELAQAQFEDLAAADGGDAELAVALGQAQLHSGNTRDAVASFDRALAIDPDRSDASNGRLDATNARPRGEATIWYGSTSNADSGLRLAEAAWWAGTNTRLAAHYDDSLSLDNPALARDGESAETYRGSVLHQFTDKVSGTLEVGRRLLPDGDQDLYRGEVVLSNLPGKLTLGAQLGAHELGYDDDLWYIGVGIPFASRWEVESNNYFSTTGFDRDKEWRSVLNVIYKGTAGWELLVGGGYGEVDTADTLNAESVTVAHTMFSLPIFDFHRLNLMLRHEDGPANSFNVAMLGVTLRLPN